MDAPGARGPNVGGLMKGISLGFSISLDRIMAPADKPRGKDRRFPSGLRPLPTAFVIMMAALPAVLRGPATPQTSSAFGCSPAKANDIVCENSKTGNPSSQWDISTGDAEVIFVLCFETAMSVQQR